MPFFPPPGSSPFQPNGQGSPYTVGADNLPPRPPQGVQQRDWQPPNPVQTGQPFNPGQPANPVQSPPTGTPWQQIGASLGSSTMQPMQAGFGAPVQRPQFTPPAGVGSPFDYSNPGASYLRNDNIGGMQLSPQVQGNQMPGQPRALQTPSVTPRPNFTAGIT